MKLPVSHQGRIALVDIGKVSLLQADSHYTSVCLDGRHHFCDLSLSQLEAKLTDDRSLKVHRSSIVNLDRAKTVHRDGDQFVLEMSGSCGHQVPVSRGSQPELRERLGA